MQDNELFELCKSLYEATGWSTGNSSHSEWWMATKDNEYHCVRRYAEENDHWSIVCPLYTSDYLLDRIPKILYKEDYSPRQDLSLVLQTNDGDWEVHYQNPQNRGVGSCYQLETTPLKALLKLTLELHKKGLLDAKDN